MFNELPELNARAAADGNYETAYHLLMAALHCVERQGAEIEALRLRRVSEQHRRRHSPASNA